MKNNIALLIVLVVLGVLIGGALGYLAMPTKEVTKVVASICPAIPACPKIDVSAVNCTNIKPRDVPKPTKEITGKMSSTRSCADWAENQNIDDKLPFCWQKKTVTGLTDLNPGCKIVYTYGC